LSSSASDAQPTSLTVTFCIKQQDFDSDIFGRPFYRITSFDLDRLGPELATVRDIPSVIIDAKLPSGEVEQAAFLMRRGFRKICMQVELIHRLQGTVSASSAEICPRLELQPDVLREHARHFLTDRFALDVCLPRESHDRLYEAWMRNSLSGARHSISVRGNNFVTFRDDGEEVKIDLVSVLDKGKGIGTDVINAVLLDAQQRGKSCVRVVTECENVPAIGLYVKTGFKVSCYYTVLHFVGA
jgi:GNAT superfamily N-acetyltransferase